MTRGVKQLEEKVGLILGNYHYSQGMLISILQDIQQNTIIYPGKP